MNISQPILPFWQWLFHPKENRLLLWWSLGIAAASFAWIKILYPYPNFIPPDSHSYIGAAYHNQAINTWPTGYSNFLRLVSCFTHSHFVLVLVQYLLLVTNLLYLLFTVQYWLSLHTWAFRIIITCSLLNPLLSHISNFVSSDSLFTAISLLWLTQLIWILFRPDKQLLFTHAVVLLLAIMVRHNALYYPAISLLAIWITHAPKATKWTGAATIILILSTYIGYTQFQYEKVSGRVQYSAFGGWQLAANALYGYAYAIPDTKRVPGKFRKLHTITNKHMDSLRGLKSRPDKVIGIYYLWNDKAPLKQYLRQLKPDSGSSFKQWASLGPLYGAYGRYLIAKHPGPFLRYFIWPNLKHYYSPPVGFMGSYNQNSTIVPPMVANWFGWKNNKLPSLFSNKKIQVAEVFTILLPVINLIFLTSFIAFVLTIGARQSVQYANGLIWWYFLIWLLNMCFSVFSAPIELRYQLFPMIMTLHAGIVLISLLLSAGLRSRKTTIELPNNIHLPEPMTAFRY